MADDDQLAFILRSLTQRLKDYGRQRNDMNVMSAMVFPFLFARGGVNLGDVAAGK
jgi:hypothetical protein